MSERRKARAELEASSGDVFADLGFDDPAQETTRAELILQIVRIVRERGLRQNEAATLLGIPQPKDRKDEKAVKEYFQKVQALMAKYGPSDQKLVEGYKKAAENEALAVLSAAQKAKWKTMLGVPFKPAGSKKA